MRTINLSFLTGLAFLAAAVGCGPQQDTGSTGDRASAPTSDDAQSTARDSTAAVQDVGELADTAWRLVRIQSMDDTESVPEDPSDYTLSFDADGRASIVADCNRGTTSFTSTSPGQLAFGVVAATQAMCPPESLHDVYMSQFEWVRSYVLEDGHLFLATMADGSILEFEPLSVAPDSQ